STSLLKDMTCPTLVVVGQDDVATPPSEAKFMAEKIPHSRLEIIPNAGHASNLEQPEAFNSVLQSFLKTIP
ncbi:MAG: alpha/beta fold hydrolase, partial [Nitrospirales bacterium]